MLASRKKKDASKAAGSVSLDRAYNDAPGAFNNVSVRPKISNGGVAFTTATAFAKGQLVAVFNGDSAIQYYRTGDSAVTAPTGPTNGIPVGPGEMVIVPLGDDTHIRASDSDMFVYTIDEDSTVS